MASLKLFLLGPPRLERDGLPLDFDTRKNVALIAYLAMAESPGGESHNREELITLLWPELEPSRARAGLRRNLSTLRKALGGEWIVVDREAVGTDPDADFWLDVDRFRSLVQAWQDHGHPEAEVCPECLAALAEAVELYRGDFLQGFTLRDSSTFDEWQFFQTEGLRQDLASALERLVRGHIAQGAHESAIRYARRWLALDPLHEPAHRHLMQLYAQAGRRSAALRQYRECVRVLEEELGVPPAAETTALYEHIRAERLRLPERDVTSRTPTPPHLVPPRLPALLAEPSEPVSVERPVFVAREHELARLAGFLDAALAGQGQAVFVTGGPGRGKTALMREFARRAMVAHPDLLVASGNCNAYSGVGDPYLPFREVMSMLTGDVEARWAAGIITRDHARRLWTALPLTVQALLDYGPSLIGTVVPGAALLSRAVAVASEGPDWVGKLKALVGWEKPGYSDLEQSALFEQFTNVLRTLAELRPLLLMLDDMQWADAGSISLLFHLGRRLEGNRIVIVCAYRPEEIALGRGGPSTLRQAQGGAGSGQRERHPLESVLSEFKRRFGDVWVNLRRADEMEGRRLVDAFLDTEPNRLGEDFRQGLFQHTGGHPLFTVELLRAMQARGDLVQDERGRWTVTPALDWRILPARVEAVIEARTGRLDDELRDILAVASVEGEWFTAQVVARVQGVPEWEVLRALSQELRARHRLVREEEEAQIDHQFLSQYRFAHALFQQYLYNGLSAGERRLLHGEIGAALEEVYRGQTQEVAVQLAHHYAEAGHREKTVEYSLRAADQARLAYANAEGVAHYRRALALLDEPSLLQPQEEWRLETLTGLGRVYLRTGKIAEAEECFREAIALGREMELASRELVRLYHWLGEVLYWQGRCDDRIRIGDEGMALLGDDTESVEAALMNQAIAVGHGDKGSIEEFQEFTYRTAGFVQRLPYSEELRPVYIHVALAYEVDRDVEEAIKWLQALEERAAQHHDLRGLVEAHHTAGMVWARTGDLHTGLSRLEAGLELSNRIGDVAHEGWCLLRMGWVSLSLGDLQKAEGCTERALDAFKAVGKEQDVACGCGFIGLISLCQKDWEKAVDALQEAVQLFRGIGLHWFEAWAIYLLAQANLARKDRGEALRRFQEALTLVGPERLSGHPFMHPSVAHYMNPLIANVLGGLEEAFGAPEALRAFCDRCRAQAGGGPFVQWYLEPAEPRQDFRFPIADFGVDSQDFENLKSQIQNEAWVWWDPFGDCSFTAQGGLEIHAANGRDLRFVNWSAPRVLRPVSGDFAVQTVCAPVSAPAPGGQPAIGRRPTVGGLVLWKDRRNYLRLDRGATGERDVVFRGCLENRDALIGRGRLAIGKSANQQMGKSSGRVFLRLERSGDRIDALCSADGERWFTVGRAAFPVEDPLQVGLHAIGNIDRTIYRDAYPDGTAIRFELFQLWVVDR